jgi:hypothetical protein
MAVEPVAARSLGGCSVPTSPMPTCADDAADSYSMRPHDLFSRAGTAQRRAIIAATERLQLRPPTPERVRRAARDA